MDNNMYKTNKRAMYEWNCDNAEYFSFFLEKQYEGIDIEKPSKRYFINPTLEENIYYIKNAKKCIYKLLSKGRIEYFTDSTWFLYNITCNFDKREYERFKIFFDFNSMIEPSIDINFVNRYIDSVAKILNINKYKKLEIYLIHTEVLEKLFGNECITGFFDPLKCKIYTDIWDINITHEIVHALMHNWGIWTNLFCHESIAEALKKPINIPKRKIKNINSFSDIYFTWETLSKEKYGVGGVFFRFLFETYGTKKIKEICCALKTEKVDIVESAIKSITCNDNLIFDFVEWFTARDWENEDWYFQNVILG